MTWKHGWLPGMAVAGRTGRHRHVQDGWLCAPNAAWAVDAVPDPNDPCTVSGGMLHLVREAYGDPLASVQAHRREVPFWTLLVRRPDGRLHRFKAESEFEVLKKALDAKEQPWKSR